MNILIIAGSSDSIHLIERLKKKNHVIYAVNHDRALFDDLVKIKGIRIESRVTSSEDLGKMAARYNINFIIDESKALSPRFSPAVVEVSKVYDIPCCRYEGLQIGYAGESIMFARNAAECVELLNKKEGNILFTIGTSTLQDFKKVKDFKKRAYAKVLPSISNLSKCETLGIPSSHIFAMQGDVTKELLQSLINQCSASVLISKDVSLNGVIEKKIDAALSSSIQIIIVQYGDKMASDNFAKIDKITFANKAGNFTELSKLVDEAEAVMNA